MNPAKAFAILAILAGLSCGCTRRRSEMRVSYNSGWDAGEIKRCERASGTSIAPDGRGDILLCDSDTQVAWIRQQRDAVYDGTRTYSVVSAKARAAVGWCKAASSKAAKWTYVYVPQGTFERLSSPEFADLVSLCKPALADLLVEATQSQPSLPFEQPEGTELEQFVPQKTFAKLPSRYQSNIQQAAMLFKFLKNKENISFSPVFTPLLGAMEDACNTMLLAKLLPTMPSGRVAEKDFFNPILSSIDRSKWKHYQDELKKLERTLVFRSPISPMGHLKFCLEYAIKAKEELGGVLGAVKLRFGSDQDKELLELLGSVYQFRNKYIAHQEHGAVPKDLAREQLKTWIAALTLLYEHSVPVAAGRA